MKTLWRFMETFHLLFAQLRDGFSILLRERWRWTTCWEAMDVCDRKFCGESRRINSRRPYYNAQFLSLGTWCKLRKSAHAIVHEQLGWSKRCARWIPHQLTTEQKEQRAKSAAIAWNYLNQMALRGFLMLLRVANFGFPSTLWKINILTWCGWPKMNHAWRS